MLIYGDFGFVKAGLEAHLFDLHLYLALLSGGIICCMRRLRHVGSIFISIGSSDSFASLQESRFFLTLGNSCFGVLIEAPIANDNDLVVD